LDLESAVVETYCPAALFRYSEGVRNTHSLDFRNSMIFTLPAYFGKALQGLGGVPVRPAPVRAERPQFNPR
jgi:hypothetical protein